MEDAKNAHSFVKGVILMNQIILYGLGNAEQQYIVQRYSSFVYPENKEKVLHELQQAFGP